MNRRPQVCVLGSAEPGSSAFDLAGEAGALLARLEITLVSGCGSPATRVADWPATVVIPSGMGDARSLLMALAGDACIVIGGRAGTISEVCLAWLHKRPLLPLVGHGGWSDALPSNPPDERRNSPSNVAGDAGLTDGHAWLSMHFTNGRSTTVGLWTTTLFEPRRFIKDPSGAILDETFDVNFGLEEQGNYRPAASRYYKLTEAQGKRAVALMGSYTGWRFTNTCASWATSILRELLGEDLDASELGGLTDTPRALLELRLRTER